MDYRLLLIWKNEAKRRYLEERISRLYDMRLAQSQEFTKVMRNLESQLKFLTPSTEKQVKDAWEDMRGARG